MLSILIQRSFKHSYQKSLSLRKRLKLFGKRTEYYFGYGANLSLERFEKRDMNVEEVGNALLKQHKIRFTLANEYKNKGYAGVHKSSGSQVWGVLYKMDFHSLKLLDTLEWCGFGAYERRKVK